MQDFRPGYLKIAQFIDRLEFLAEINAFYERLPEAGGGGETIRTGKNGEDGTLNAFKRYKEKVVSQGRPSAYESWSPEEDKMLIKEYSNGVEISEISMILRRISGAIRSRLKKLGAIPG